MVRAQKMLALVAVLFAAAPLADKGIKPIATLAKEVKVDGDLKDLAPATELKLPDSARGASAGLAVKAAFRKDTLYLGVTVKDDQVLAGDFLDLTLYFPDSGTTSQGVVYRFGSEGTLEAPMEVGAADWAQALVKAATRRDEQGYTLEIAVPARALPRFQAFKPLMLSLCFDYSDVDSAGAAPTRVSTCPSGDMPQGPARLPDELRKNLKPSAEVEGLEGRATGWVGFSKLHYACWAEGDAALTPASLAELVLGEAAVEPAKVALPIPDQFVLPDNRPIYPLLSGRNPFAKSDTCVSGNELRMALYVVKGTTAMRVLEWPVATCRLGRAMQLELSAEGNLTIGYTSGTTAHFVWSVDHFERSELGLAR